MYNLTQTAQLLTDIGHLGKLAEGGSHYPNAECCFDGAQTLLKVKQIVDTLEEEVKRLESEVEMYAHVESQLNKKNGGHSMAERDTNETLAERLRGSMCAGDRSRAADRIEELEAAVTRLWHRVDECQGYGTDPEYGCIEKLLKRLFETMPDLKG